MDPLFVEVPPPLEKFSGEPILDDSNNIILEDAIDKRLLHKQELKVLQAKLKDLKKKLQKRNYESVLARIEEIKLESEQIRVKLYNLRAIYDSQIDSDKKLIVVRQAHRLKKRRTELLNEYNQIHQEHSDTRRMYRRFQALQNRLEEHNAAVHYQRQHEELSKEMNREVNYFADKLQIALTQLGFCRRYSVGNKLYTDKVKFEKAVVCPDEIQYKIKVQSRTVFNATINHLPNGVNAVDLIKPETIAQLQVALERPVYSPIKEGESDYHQGLWICVRRNGIAGGILEYITYNQIMSKYDSRNRHLLPLPLGVRAGRVVNWVNLAENPHVMISGKSGAGKSNVINVIISTLISRHSPEEIRLILVDLKEGAELERYQVAPHVIGNVLTQVDEVAQMLSNLEKLRIKRMREIKKIATNIDEYNALVPPERRIERILVVFDEYAAIKLDKELAKQINALTDQIAAKARAAGIHLLIGTQASFADVMSQLTRINISVQIAGAQQNLGGSLATVGSGAARELPNIPGRMLIVVNADSHTVQMPHINQTNITEAIQASQDYEKPIIGDLDYTMNETSEPEQHETEKLETLILDYAIEYLDGHLKARLIWDEYLRDSFSLTKITDCVKVLRESETITHRDITYKVIKVRSYCRLEVINSQMNEKTDMNNDDVSHDVTHDDEMKEVA